MAPSWSFVARWKWLERAKLAELELWAERVLTARNLAAVFAD